MKANPANSSKTILWVFAVYILSFICYFPELLVQNGIAVSSGFLLLKYLFVCIPALISVLFLISEGKLKIYLSRMFSGKITLKHILTWIIFALVGILASLIYSFTAKTDVFQSTYSSPTALFISCIYLFITGAVEEAAWRGFLLERFSCKMKGFRSILLVGIIWTVWHMPMWIIRNSLSIWQIIPLCIWTLLVSIILGTAYYQCKNVIFIALLHAAFNICYLAPVPYNAALLTGLIVSLTLLGRKSHKMIIK